MAGTKVVLDQVTGAQMVDQLAGVHVVVDLSSGGNSDALWIEWQEPFRWL